MSSHIDQHTRDVFTNQGAGERSSACCTPLAEEHAQQRLQTKTLAGTQRRAYQIRQQSEAHDGNGSYPEGRYLMATLRFFNDPSNSSFGNNDSDDDFIKDDSSVDTREDQNNQGEFSDIEAIYHQFQQEIYAHIVVSAHGDLEEAKDILQDTFVSAWQHRLLLSTFEHARLRKWLYTTASRKLIDRHRRKQKWLRSVDSCAQQLFFQLQGQRQPEELAGDKERIMDAFSCLSQREQQCVLLRYRGFQFSEIAQMLNIGDSSARGYMTNVHKKIRKYLEKSH
ncbi:MAG TPA: sigma-70 family RNA polymerase sigma factor [Dictyobacter sp.]|nr:sigma-70 family RNA polymerase sigma factor [Dictyobacter sp.]